MREHDVTALTADELAGSPPAVCQLGSGPARITCPRAARAQVQHVTGQPAPEDAALLTDVLRKHQQWSVFWDTHYHLWRATEDDPDSDLYIESPDAATIIRYITARS